MFRSSQLFLLSFSVTMMVYSVTAEVKSEFQHKMENFALSRDGFYRKNPDDDFTHGFFAAWPVILLILAGAFFLIALISLVGYVTGLCAPPAQTAQGINYKPVAQV